MSRPEPPPAAPAVAPRAFLALAVSFLLLYAGVLGAARQQKAVRGELENVVPLPPLPESVSPTPKPAPTPLEP